MQPLGAGEAEGRVGVLHGGLAKPCNSSCGSCSPQCLHPSTHPLPPCSFLAYVSEIVVDGLAKTIVASLDQMHSQVSAQVLCH